MTILARTIVSALILASLISGCAQAQKPAASPNIEGRTSDAAWKALPAIVESIVVPTFPDREYNVTDFGAAGDGKTDSKPAINAAIAKCFSQGGGKVIIPPGNYISNGPIHLKSNINLVISKGATVVFGSDPNFYLPMVLTKWEGTECYNYSPLIYGYHAINVAITGSGTIDGSGHVWKKWRKLQAKAKARIRTFGRQGAPVYERTIGPGYFARPQFIQPFGCKNVLIEGIRIQNSPFWTMNLALAYNVTVRNVTVDSHNFSDDGCDPDAATNVLIEGCNFNTNDDSIAIKAGRDQDAWRIGVPTQNIVVRNCTFSSEWGAVAIGSEMSGGVRNVFVENCRLGSMTQGVHLKSNFDRGGFIKDVYVRNLTIDKCVGSCIYIHKDYYSSTERGTGYPAVYDNIYIENIRCKDANSAVVIDGTKDSPVTNVTLKNIVVENAKTPSRISHAPGLKVENVLVNGKPLDIKD